MTAVFWTVIAGVVLLLVGRLLGILTLDPWQDQRKTIGEIDFNLLYLANVYGNPTNPDRAKTMPPHAFQRVCEAGDALRRCACRLDATTNAIVGYPLLARFPGVPSVADVQEAVGHLIYLANTVFDSAHHAGRYNRKLASEVRTLLCLVTPSDQPSENAEEKVAHDPTLQRT